MWGEPLPSYSCIGRRPRAAAACVLGSRHNMLCHLRFGPSPSRRLSTHNEKRGIHAHQNMGEVVEVGSAVRNRKKDERVVVPFTISCGECADSRQGLFSCCDTTNPNAAMAAKAMVAGRILRL